MKEGFTILAIESSCDETACAIIRDGRQVVSDVIATQIEIHRRFGGVVPEIASRNHTLAIESVVAEAMKMAGVTKDGIDAIAVTYGAGLLGALLVGVNFAKSLAYAWGKPLYGVSHIMGHIAANYIGSDLQPPYICLLASGGHTAVIEVEEYNKIRALAVSRDDAAGEAFDKVARILGFPYPGGPEIERAAKNGKPVYDMPKVNHTGEFFFSYSGLKTYVNNLVHNLEQRGEAINRADIAASFQKAAVDQLLDGIAYAVKRTGIHKVAIAGGVSANELLRSRADKMDGVQIYYPKLRYCTDNAAMIGTAAYYMIADGIAPSDLTLDAKATVPLE